MRTVLSRFGLTTLLALACAFVPVVLAQQGPDTQGGGDEQDIQQTVARVAFVTGDASYQRGDDPDQWQPLEVNVPMTIGDRLYSAGSGRLELEAPALRAFVAPNTELTILNLVEGVQQYSMAEGTATFRISRRADGDVFEIDTPNAAVTLEGNGLYRVTVDADGNTRVWVRRGGAQVSAGGGEVALRTGEAMRIDGIDAPEYDVFALPLADPWDRWVDSRERRPVRAGASYEFASQDIPGVSDLDANGRWEDTPEYGHVWFPTNVAADWAPYRVGHWLWQDPWGWTWVSSEPWGWAPYHYGRWVVRGSRWGWVPVAPRERRVVYAPALVAFVGEGPGAGGFVGWFPLGPRDPIAPWWGRRRAAPASVVNVTYVNRTYVTVVDRGAFVGARPVHASLVRDTAVLRQAAAQPVLRGPLPVLPTAGSLHVPRPERAVPAPPRRIVERPVVARLAPPPAPPAFTQKLNAIRESHGAPLSPSAAAQLASQSPQGARAAGQVRPVARENGRVELAPRKGAQGVPQPAPIRGDGRTLAPRAGEAPRAMPPAREAARDDAGKAPAEAPRAPAREQAPAPRRVESAPTPAPERTAPPAIESRRQGGPPQAPPPQPQAPPPPQPTRERFRERPPQAQPTQAPPPQAERPPQPERPAAERPPQPERHEREAGQAPRRAAEPTAAPAREQKPKDAADKNKKDKEKSDKDKKDQKDKDQKGDEKR